MELEYLSGEFGSMKIADEVIETIASVAATEVDGVTAVTAKSPMELNVGGLKLNSKSRAKAIRVENSEQGLHITVGVVVRYGEKLPLIAERVQDNIYHNVETMTGISALSVTVNVVGVASEKTE